MCATVLFLFVPRTVSVGRTSSEEQRHLVNVAEAKNDATITQESRTQVFRINHPREIEVIEYIVGTFGKDSENIVVLFRCESSFKTTAYNPEEEAKRRGITQYSSCGVAQINDPRCVDVNNDGMLDEDSELADYKYNIDVAKDLFERRGYQPWTNCARKLGFID